MTERLLLCTDLDRTLIPNGPQVESPGARALFQTLAARPEVTLAYVSGRDRNLVEEAAGQYQLPFPDFVIADVGSSIYRIDAKREWHLDRAWEAEIALDWGPFSHDEVAGKLSDLTSLKLQEPSKQNRYKLSYYVPLSTGSDTLADRIVARLQSNGIRARLIWSVDAPAHLGLLDVLPARVSKYHAIEWLMQEHGFMAANTVFCGDSGNDLEVLVSPIPAVLVANAEADVRRMATMQAKNADRVAQLYVARGGFMGMNGNYSAGILEGIAHYYPHTARWMLPPACDHKRQG
jgi:sucrose-6F-phosphate phosphohydrolase